jgi:hypothetical protein
MAGWGVQVTGDPGAGRAEKKKTKTKKEHDDEEEDEDEEEEETDVEKERGEERELKTAAEIMAEDGDDEIEGDSDLDFMVRGLTCPCPPV